MATSHCDQLSDPVVQKNVQQWLKGDYDAATKAELEELLKSHPQEVVDAFYTTLSFGTGGLRGLMGVGSNRMNKYTVAAATQGLANYVSRQPFVSQAQGIHSVAIGFDSRHHSHEFAKEAACVLAGNGIRVYLFERLAATPLVSFACRYKKCSAAIMITASHNPPRYNGYKVYWKDGGQVVPPHDKAIIEEVKKIRDNNQIKSVSFPNPLIEEMGEEVEKAYLQAIFPLRFYPKEDDVNGGKVEIVYSNLHGTGITMVPQALKSWGFTHFSLVEEQQSLDGNFPTVSSPNPEEEQALALGIKKMIATHADLFLATDPDADRMGVVVNHRGKSIILTGNEIACLCLEHLCAALLAQQRMPARAAFIKSIVTTELFKAIATHYRGVCFDVLPGFKYIAEKIRLWEESSEGYCYLFGAEESYGYLLGTHTRDKDAILSCALLAEVALQAKKQDKTLVDQLYDLYRKYGIYREKLLSLSFEESKAGKEEIERSLRTLRQHPPKSIKGIAIDVIEDYDSLTRTSLTGNKPEFLTLPKSNVLLFRLADGSKLVVRPSGTEPKIKLYCGAVQRISTSDDIAKAIASCDAHADELLGEVRSSLLKG